jgi:hypothetical protein
MPARRSGSRCSAGASPADDLALLDDVEETVGGSFGHLSWSDRARWDLSDQRSTASRNRHRIHCAPGARQRDGSHCTSERGCVRSRRHHTADSSRQAPRPVRDSDCRKRWAAGIAPSCTSYLLQLVPQVTNIQVERLAQILEAKRPRTICACHTSDRQTNEPKKLDDIAHPRVTLLPKLRSGFTAAASNIGLLPRAGPRASRPRSAPAPQFDGCLPCCILAMRPIAASARALCRVVAIPVRRPGRSLDTHVSTFSLTRSIHAASLDLSANPADEQRHPSIIIKAGALARPQDPCTHRAAGLSTDSHNSYRSRREAAMRKHKQRAGRHTWPVPSSPSKDAQSSSRTTPRPDRTGPAQSG